MNPLFGGPSCREQNRSPRVASNIGFVVPPTIVTNSLARAEEFAKGAPGDTVIKTLSSAYFSLSDQSFVLLNHSRITRTSMNAAGTKHL